MEYGRAFAYINQVDYLLGSFIDYQKKRQKKFDQTCQTKTLGQKIKEEESFIPGVLLADLTSFNAQRRTFAHHGFIMLQENDNQMRPSTIKGSGDIIKIGAVELADIEKVIKLGKKLAELLFEEFKK